tara:strand:- start:482 stop:1471 length:990 start_codon:yes stop_codon:yes gene_type:complete
MNNPSIFIGPMSKNVVDSVIEYSNTTGVPIGLIPSRRQIEYNQGYVNNWTTEEFANYVKERTSSVILQRDHGGRLQNSNADSLLSFEADASSGFDLIHVDPWKFFTGLDEVIDETVKNILFCESKNPSCDYEIGTEEAIHKYTCEELEYFLSGVKESLGASWSKIKYAVIQSGTAISATDNIGVFNAHRCERMIGVCRAYGLLSKEHNGDYLSIKEVKQRFDLGLSAINIAPQFGVSETRQIMKAPMMDNNLFERIFQLCYNSRKWVKWFPVGFEVSTDEDKKKLIEVSGHYIFTSAEFQDVFKVLGIENQQLVKNHIDYISSLHKGLA